MLDEAVPYFLKASRMADEWQYSSICQEVAKAYAAAGRFREGVLVLDLIRKDMNDRKVVDYHLAKGNLWAGVNEYDSAVTYYRTASISLNRWVAAEASRLETKRKCCILRREKIAVLSMQHLLPMSIL